MSIILWIGIRSGWSGRAAGPLALKISGQAQVAQNSRMDKIFRYSEKFQGTLCFSRQAQVVQKSWMINNISIHWQISRHTLFFRASASCSKILNDKKYIFSTVKNLRYTLFFRASASCSKILHVKSMFNAVKNFRASASCSKILNVKSRPNSIQSKISGQTLFFGQAQIAQKSWT